MSTIKSSDEHLTLNADGSSKDIKFQANGVEKASISSAGAFTSTTIDATALTGNLPAISGASLTGLPNGSQLDHSGTKRLDTNGAGIGIYSSTPALSWKEADGATKMDINFGANATDVAEWNVHPAKDIRFRNNSTTTLTLKSDGRGLSQFTAKGWVHFGGNGTVSIADSHNVSSITDSSSGHFQINWSNNMANTNYSVACTSGHNETANQNDSFTITSFRHQGILTNKVEIQCLRARFDVQQTADPYIVCLVAFGD